MAVAVVAVQPQDPVEAADHRNTVRSDQIMKVQLEGLAMQRAA